MPEPGRDEPWCGNHDEDRSENAEVDGHGERNPHEEPLERGAGAPVLVDLVERVLDGADPAKRAPDEQAAREEQEADAVRREDAIGGVVDRLGDLFREVPVERRRHRVVQ